MKSPYSAQDKFVYLVMASFVFVSSFAISQIVVQNPGVVEVKKPQDLVLSKSYVSRPVLREDTVTFPVVSAQGVLVYDVDSGVTLYEKNPDIITPPASTTKIITALVALDYYDPEAIFTIGGISVDGQKMGLVAGERISVKSLLYGLLVYSANDAAEALAQSYPGGRSAFISSMNVKANDFGLINTHFANPSGLDSSFHYSTARDLVKVSVYAMKNPLFAQLVSTKELEVRSVDQKIVHKLQNINELLGEVYGVVGIKTGWTENARENLVTYVERGGKKLIIALLGSQDRFGETKEIIEWSYVSFDWKSVTYTYSGE